MSREGYTRVTTRWKKKRGGGGGGGGGGGAMNYAGELNACIYTGYFVRNRSLLALIITTCNYAARELLSFNR